MKHLNNFTRRIELEGIIFKWYMQCLNISQKQTNKYVNNYVNMDSNVEKKPFEIIK